MHQCPLATYCGAKGHCRLGGDGINAKGTTPLVACGPPPVSLSDYKFLVPPLLTSRSCHKRLHSRAYAKNQISVPSSENYSTYISGSI